ncbi:MAG TPA: hypothetical protein VHD55_02670 [Candidatus Paceibacterota bacterium]|nr:hypothetical protein [Candidatus Paceibacterota bacterium]
MTDTLSKLFGSAARVKLLRLFLFNNEQTFTVAEAAARIRVNTKETSREMLLLRKLGAIVRDGRGTVPRYRLNGDFSYLRALQALLLNAPERANDIYARIKKSGTLKLVVVAGVFVGDWEGRVDLLVVGDRVDEPTLRRAIRLLESEVGKEIRYTLLTTQEFYYRLNMNDHLVRDVLDFTHRIVFDRLDIGLE